MTKYYVTLLGKVVQRAARLRGGGSAFPGLFVEKIDPSFIKRSLSSLPRGIVMVSGTNGKTTTTKMVVELLESQGLKVFTNRTGSNFSRGIAAALLKDISVSGKLDADIAVLELDEAHGVHFARQIPPDYTLVLNVMRDQLDRFGEIDKTAELLERIAKSTTSTVVLNRHDKRVANIAKSIPDKKVVYFGLDQKLETHFPSDDDLHEPQSGKPSTLPADVELKSIDENKAQFEIEGRTYLAALNLRGIYNVYNAAAALTLVRAVMGEQVDNAKLVNALQTVNPAFGRGETLVVGGQPLELVLVKNPSGFRLALESFSPKDYATMIAINDNYADGRDMSWLWDVQFESLKQHGVEEVSGVRAYDMALRLQYDGIKITHINPSIREGLRHFISAASNKPKRIFCTYTAMTALRRELAKITDVEEVS